MSCEKWYKLHTQFWKIKNTKITEFFCDVMLLDIVIIAAVNLRHFCMVLGKIFNPVLKVAWA